MLETCDLWPFSSNYEWHNDIMNTIMNNKMDHNIMKDIEQLCISQMAYLLRPATVPVGR